MTGKRHSMRSGRSGRDAIRTLRAQPPVIDPCPVGTTGGDYQPLSQHEMESIFDTAVKVLEQIGMDNSASDLTDRALQAGAHLSDAGRLCFPRSMIEDVVATACQSFVFFGRDPKHDIEVGGSRVYFGTGGAAVQTMDLESGSYRPSTIKDLYDFTRLADTLKNISWFTRCCVATDIPNNFDLDINTAYALLKGTTKPVGTSFFAGDHVDPAVRMFDLVLGGEGEFRKRPFCKAHISPVVSPLRYGEDAVFVAIAAMRNRMPLNCIIAAQSGATAPAAPAGMLVSTLAETLAALIMVNVFESGYPMIFSNWPFVIDLRTGAFAGSGGEISVLNAAAAQITNWLGLPSGVASSMADAKAVDAQMGFEKGISATATGLAGGNLIYESSGMMASLLGVSFEAFVIDDEMLCHVYRLMRGIEVNEETMGFEAIREAVFGEGHFLGGQHTMAAMERDYYYPAHSNRQDPDSWMEDGKQTIREKANAHVRKVLADHHPDYIDSRVDAQLRRQFNIVLH
ncbi:MAG: trimethylamine methyltransferase family protein [Acidiferrobacterales bacterium]|nr:trimethylamine methyltransferase family protein [Acidiferrobacterales bacterium]